MTRFATILFAALLLPPAFASAAAEPVQAKPVRTQDDSEGIFTFQFENDLFAGNDSQYTNGVRAAYLSPEDAVPGFLEDFAVWLPFFPQGSMRRTSLAFGQSMYTPDNITVQNPDPDDRPYAGWLYGSAGLVSDTGSQYDSLQLTLGIVGPASLADETQKFVHSTFGRDIPQGWEFQLDNEPGIILEYQRAWRNLADVGLFGLQADATPYVGGTLGNIFTYAGSGLTLRIGHDLTADYGPPRIRPSLPGSDFFLSPKGGWGWYLFSGVEGRAVARNIFLDGNTFSDSRSVDKRYLVGDFQLGGALTFERTRLALTHVIRSEEFETQDGITNYTALTLSRRF